MKIEGAEKQLSGEHSPKITLDPVERDEVENKGKTDAKAAYVDQENFRRLTKALQ